MSTGEELYDIIVAANVELQNILSLLLNIYADVRAISNPPAPGENNLCSLLSTDFDLLKVVVKDYVSGKLYTSQDKIAVLPNIDSRAFDSSLLLDLLIKFVVTEYNYGNCNNCVSGGCCVNCDHSLWVNCIKCRGNGGNPTNKCCHKCKGCKTPAKDCPKTICCTACNSCLTCNKVRFDDYVTAILNDDPPPPLPCLWYAFTHSLDLSKHFRNLFGHVTVEECRKFITNETAHLEHFEMCSNLEQLEKYVTFIFSNIVAHAKTKITDPSTVALTEVNKTMSNVACIFKHGEPLKTYLADRYSKIKEIFIDDVRFYDRLDKQVSRFEKMIKESENNIINFMKEHLCEKHTLQISIRHYRGELDFNLSSQIQCRDSHFPANGSLINVIHNILPQVFDENLGLQQWIDYEFKVQSLMIKNANNSHLEFKMKVNENDEYPFPEHLTGVIHEKTLAYLERFKSQIKSSIFDKLNEDEKEKTDIEIKFQGWSKGLIIINSIVSYISGKFTNAQQKHMLNIIKDEGKVFFDINRVYTKQLTSPSIDLVVNVKAGGDVIDRVKESEDAIKKCFVKKINSSPEEEKTQRSDTLLAHTYTHDEVQLQLDEKVTRILKVKIRKHSPGQKIELNEPDEIRLGYYDEEKVTIIKICHQIKEGCKYDYELIVEDEHQWRWKASVAQLDPFDVNHVELKNPTTNNKLLKVAYNQSNIDNELSIAEKIPLGFKASFNADEHDCIETVQYKKHSLLSWYELDVSQIRQPNENRHFIECNFPSSGIYKFRVLVRSKSGIYRFITLDDIEIFDLEHTSSCSQTMLMFHPYGECNDVHHELEVLPRKKGNVQDGMLVSIKPPAGGIAKRDIDKLDNYVEQNFRNQNLFSFPPLYMISLDSSYYQIVERFETYYQNCINAKAIILSGADLCDNLLTLGYEDKDVAKLCNDTTRTENVFVFDSNKNTVFVINVCKEEEANAETLKYHHRQCNNSARLFLTINQHIIGRHPMAIVGIVACLNGSREDMKDMIGCRDCFQQTLTKDDLKSIEFFSVWFDQLNLKVEKYSSSHVGKSDNNDFVFKDIPNRLLLLSAIKNFSLPATSFGTEEEKLSRLVLNYAQIHAVYDEKSSKKVIKGGYGSGKTLVLKKALEILVTAGIPTIVYYILFDPYSMVNMDIFNYASSIPNSILENVFVKNVYQLSHEAKATKVFTLSECLQYIKKLHPNETTHALVDEYDEEELTQIQALQIKHLLTSSENFKDATVVISVQSVEKHSAKFDDDHTSTRDNALVDWKTTGMELYKLPHTMRSTNNISDLVETFQEGVRTKENVIHLPVESTEEPSLVEESLKETTGKRNSLRFKLRRLFSFGNHGIRSNHSSNESSVPNPSTRDRKLETASSTNSLILQAEASIDTLAATSLTSSHHSSRIKRSFTFIPSKPGHKIIGTRPKLLRLENSNYIDVSIVQYYIQNYCFNEAHRNKALFICNKINLMQSFVKVFKFLSLRTFKYYDSILDNRPPPSFVKQKNAYDKLMNHKEKNLLVLTDIRGCRGLEYGKVICVVDESNEHERHMLVEGLSRATSQLYILSIRGKNNETNISKIMDNLVEKKYVDDVSTHCREGIANMKYRNLIEIKELEKQDKSDKLKKKYEAMTFQSVLQEEDITRDWNFKDLDALIKNERYVKVHHLISIQPLLIRLRGGIDGFPGKNYNLLHSASLHGSDVDFVQHLINAGCSLKEKDYYNWMPIHVAARNNHADIAKVLLENDPSLVNETIGGVGFTPLHLATNNNHKDVVKLLLTRPNIVVDVKDYRGWTADEYHRTNNEIKRMIRQHRKNNSL